MVDSYWSCILSLFNLFYQASLPTSPPSQGHFRGVLVSHTSIVYKNFQVLKIVLPPIKEFSEAITNWFSCLESGNPVFIYSLKYKNVLFTDFMLVARRSPPPYIFSLFLPPKGLMWACGCLTNVISKVSLVVKTLHIISHQYTVWDWFI